MSKTEQVAFTQFSSLQSWKGRSSMSRKQNHLCSSPGWQSLQSANPFPRHSHKMTSRSLSQSKTQAGQLSFGKRIEKQQQKASNMKTIKIGIYLIQKAPLIRYSCSCASLRKLAPQVVSRMPQGETVKRRRSANTWWNRRLMICSKNRSQTWLGFEAKSMCHWVLQHSKERLSQESALVVPLGHAQIMHDEVPTLPHWKHGNQSKRNREIGRQTHET